MRIALVDKMPSNTRYDKYFKFEFDHYHLSSKKITKVLKKDVDIQLDVDIYDYVILIGSEAVKYYTKATVTDHAGSLVDGKFIPLQNPSITIFKPEALPAIERAIEQLHKILSGELLIDVSGYYPGIQDEDEAMAWIAELEQDAAESGLLALDTETTALYPRDGYVLGISMCAKPRKAAYVSSDVITEEFLERLQKLIFKHEVIFHNAKFDIKMLEFHFGLKIPPTYHDTILIHYLLDETQGTHGLKQLAIKYTKFGDYDAALEQFKKQYCKIHRIKESDFTYDLIPFDILSDYAAKDTAVTLEIFNFFYPILSQNSKLMNVYRNLMIPGSTALKIIEENGIPISMDRMKFAKQTIDKSIQEARDTLYSYPEVRRLGEVQGEPFNPNSVQQLRVLLFDMLGLNPMQKKTGTGMQSTDAEVLEDLEGKHPIVSAILTVRKLNKIKNTYVDKIIEQVDKDGRIRTGFNMTATTSGRLSSSGKFNAQQLPRDESRVKGAIKARPSFKIVSQDLKTAEVYYAAVLSGDPKLQDVFRLGGDLHSTIAKMVFNLACDASEVKTLYPGERQAAKAITFGILYGSGPQKVADTVTKEGMPMSVAEAREVIEQYFDTFKQLRKWLDTCKAQIQHDGFCYTSLGRKRRLKNVFSPDNGIASHEIRSGINAMVQALASDINLLALVDLLQEVERYKLRAKVFMLVHDSIVAEVHEEDIEKYLEILASCTQRARGFEIPGFPIGIDQEVGDDYSFGKFDKMYGEAYAEFLESDLSRI